MKLALPTNKVTTIFEIEGLQKINDQRQELSTLPGILVGEAEGGVGRPQVETSGSVYHYRYLVWSTSRISLFYFDLICVECFICQ